MPASTLGNKIVAIAHDAKVFDLHFILNREMLLKWQPELIMNEQNVLCMRKEHLFFLDRVSFLPLALSSVPEELGLTASKSWYTHYFNRKANMDNVGRIADIGYYGDDAMNESERAEFLR
jgi:hypothetical protein